MTTTEATTLTEAELDDYFASVDRVNLAPLWRLHTMSREPRTSVQPYVWRWRDVYPQLRRAGEIMKPATVQGEGASERRVLLLTNPGTRDTNSATNTLVAGLQLIFPGEIAPAHRHTATAIRMVIQGHGAYTTVEGERALMEPGDLILTPQWTWHDHGNESSEPIVWMDGLDRVLVAQLNAVFFDPYPTGSQELTLPVDYSAKKYGGTTVRPVWEPVGMSPPRSPQIHYKWTDTQAALRRLADLGETGPFGEIAVAYVNPGNGGHVSSTIGCLAQMLPPGAPTRARRHTGSGVYHVLGGSGQTIVNGQRMSWEKGDCFAVPPWAWYEHASTSDSEEAFLFCMNDLPTLEALGLHREQAYEEHSGHQPVTGDLR